VNLEATVYQKRITDLLLTRTLAPTSGFGIQVLNAGVLRNRGVELQLNVLPVQKPSFQWRAGGTFSATRCTIIDLGGVPGFIPVSFLNAATFGHTKIEKDSSCTQLYGNDSIGSQGPNDPGISPTTPIGTRIDRKITDANPSYRFGINSDITIKRWSFYFLVDRQKGGVLLNATGLLYDLSGTSPDWDAPGFKTPKSGPLKGVLGKDRGKYFAKCVKCFLEDVAYWKLREVRVSWDLPTSFVKSMWNGARYARVGLSGRNLLTITNFRGADPENNEIQRSAAEGVPWEIWAYPPSRSLFLNIDIGF